LNACFPAVPSGRSLLPRLEVVGDGPGDEPIDVRCYSAIHAAAMIAGDVLECFISDVLAQNDPRRQAEVQLEQFDRNRDQRLERDEAASQPELLNAWEAVDTNRDDHLDLDELTDSFRRRQALPRCQLQIRIDFPTDFLFFHLDANRDGRLVPREWKDLPQLFRRWDGDGDGRLVPGEMPAALRLGIARGATNDASQWFRPPAASSPVDDQAVPAWVLSMDRNGDSEISQREFPGTAEQFTRLDRDGDGWLSVAEASAIGAD